MYLRQFRRILCRSTPTWRGIHFDRARSTMGGRHYIHSAAPMSLFIWQWFWILLTACHRLGAGARVAAGLAVQALQMALSGHNWKAEGLIHRSDRGIQYASSEYTELLEKGEIQIGVSRRGNQTITHAQSGLCEHSKRRKCTGLTIGI